MESFLNRIRKVEVKGVGFELKDNPQKFYTAVEKLMDFEGRALIVVDELAVFLEHITTAQGPEAAENLMNWLRNIRQSHQGRIVWVYCSSVSITNFVKRHNMSYTINDISSFPLGEMAYDEAVYLLKELCYGQGIEVFADNEIDVILEKIGWRLPFFIQLFFKNFIQNQASYKGQPMDKVVDEIVSIIIREHQIATWSESCRDMVHMKSQLSCSLIIYASRIIDPTDLIWRRSFLRHVSRWKMSAKFMLN